MQQLNGEAAVVDVPAHTVVEVFGVLFVFEKADRMVHQPQAEPDREYLNAEIRNGGLYPAAVGCLAVIPLVEYQRAREYGHCQVQLLTERGVRRFVVTEDIESDTDVDRVVRFCELGGENRVVHPELSELIKVVFVGLVGVEGEERRKLALSDFAEFIVVLS